MSNAFTYLGAYAHSCQIPFIDIGQARVNRDSFWRATIAEHVARIPVSEQPVFIATGGGYGSFNGLVDTLKRNGSIDPAIPVADGNLFRDSAALEAEKETVRGAIRKHLAQTLKTEPSEEQVNQILSPFYSDEVNTKLVKGVLTDSGEVDKRFPKSLVLRCFDEKRSIIHVSASIYPDAEHRAALAHTAGMKTRLVAGTKPLATALKELEGSQLTPFMIASSYQRFSEQFQDFLAAKFDEIELYDTGRNPPVLIAEKKGAGQELIVHDKERYDAFLQDRNIDTSSYTTEIDNAHVLSQGHIGKDYGVVGPVDEKKLGR